MIDLIAKYNFEKGQFMSQKNNVVNVRIEEMEVQDANSFASFASESKISSVIDHVREEQIDFEITNPPSISVSGSNVEIVESKILIYYEKFTSFAH